MFDMIEYIEPFYVIKKNILWLKRVGLLVFHLWFVMSKIFNPCLMLLSLYMHCLVNIIVAFYQCLSFFSFKKKKNNILLRRLQKSIKLIKKWASSLFLIVFLHLFNSKPRRGHIDLSITCCQESESCISYMVITM